jgi:dienelactone hydrolase
VRALRTKKPHLADVKVYATPPGGHLFDRRVREGTWEPETSREQQDSWARVWTFFEARLPRARQLTN